MQRATFSGCGNDKLHLLSDVPSAHVPRYSNNENPLRDLVLNYQCTWIISQLYEKTNLQINFSYHFDIHIWLVLFSKFKYTRHHSHESSHSIFNQTSLKREDFIASFTVSFIKSFVFHYPLLFIPPLPCFVTLISQRSKFHIENPNRFLNRINQWFLSVA